MVWLNLSRLNFIYVVVELIVYLIVGPHLIPTSYIIVLLLFYLLILLTESSFFMYFYLKVRKMEGVWDTSSINKVKPYTTKWIKAQVRQLLVGDLVLLKRNTVAPADVLIIDTSDNHFSDQILYTNERRVTGCNRMTTKRAVKNLRGKNTSKTDSEALKLILPTLDGYLEYEGPSERVHSFTGIFKLNNDPQVSKVSHRNVLFCGTQLHTEWMIGIVLFTGQQTKIVQMNMVNWTKFERFRKEIKVANASYLINYLMLIMMCFSVVFACFATISIQMRPELNNETQFINKFIDEKNSEINNLAMIFQNFSLFVPQLMVIVYEVACFLVGMQIQNKFESEQAKVARKAAEAMQDISTYKGRRSGRKKSSKLSTDINSSSDTHRRSVDLLSTERLGRQPTGIRPRRGHLTNHGTGFRGLMSTRFSNRTNLTTQSTRRVSSGGITASSEIDKEDEYIRVINYEALPSLGSITHVVFDKTDTLTMSTMHVCQVSTAEKIYKVESEIRLYELMDLYLENPQEFEFEEDLEENKAKENSFYSEKSQEYANVYLGTTKRSEVNM